MNVLFITYNDINNTMYGGGQCSARNYSAIKKENNIEIVQISKKSTMNSAFSAFGGHFPPLSNSDISRILQYVEENRPDIVFLDASSLGEIAALLKNKNSDIHIITFFHNVEIDYIDVRLGSSLKKYLYRPLVCKAERLSIENSNKIVCLNERDSRRLKELYGRNADYIIPITFKDCFKESFEVSPFESEPSGIIVGSYKVDTMEGVEWFCNNVAPFTNVNYYIIGKGFEKVKDILENKNVHVIGTVEDVAPYYQFASFVCLPILNGAGMKVKTAEALMYGKYIFGTTEALEGYDVNYTLVGGLCNSKDEFIYEINSFIEKNKPRFNTYSREMFMKHYSDEIAFELFHELIESENLQKE